MKMKSYTALGLLILASCNHPSGNRQPALHPVKAFLDRLLDSAHMYLENNNHATSVLYHRKVLQVARKNGFHEYEARALLGIGKLMKTERADSSMFYLENALKIADSLGHTQLRADIHYSIAGTQRQRQKYQEAMNALEMHHEILDTLLTTQREKEMTQLKQAALDSRRQTIGKVVGISVLFILSLLIWYSRKVRKLNLRLISAVKLRDKLLSIISHDLRGPAGSLSQVLQLLSKGGVPKAGEQALLQKAALQGEAISQGFENLLTWANTQVKGRHGHPKRFFPASRIQTTLALLDGLAQQKDIRIKLDVSDGITVTADEDQFDFMVRNLISNAIKFSHPGGRIFIRGQQEGIQTKISFTDEGPGIRIKDQKDFWKEEIVSHKGTLGEKGTGLGLLLVKEFVETNKGNIYFENGPEGVGTVFTITLPS